MTVTHRYELSEHDDAITALQADSTTKQATIDALTAQVAELEHHEHMSSVTEVHGSGTSNPSKLMWKMMQTLEERIKHPTLVSGHMHTPTQPRPDSDSPAPCDGMDTGAMVPSCIASHTKTIRPIVPCTDDIPLSGQQHRPKRVHWC